MKVDRKQLSIYSGLVFFIILAIFTIVLEQSMAGKVFSSYDSQIVHEKECKELDFSMYLIEFPSLQQAITDGALSCKFCIGQYSSHSGEQQSLISNTQFNPQVLSKGQQHVRTQECLENFVLFSVGMSYIVPTTILLIHAF